MIRILEFLIAMVLVVVTFVVVGLALPSHRHVYYTTETNRPLPVVFDMLSGFKRFRDWTSLTKQDPKVQFSLSGPDSGKGARVDYTSSTHLVGNGSWEVGEVVPGERIVYKLSNGDYGSEKTMSLRFKKVGNQLLSVEITEDYDVDYGWNLFGRYAGLYVTRSVGDMMKASLANLGNLLATIPKFDYTQLGAAPQIVKLPAENLLIAPTKAKRDNEVVKAAMLVQEKWLHQVIDKNGLVAAGPLRVITTSYGPDTYEFELAIPVHKTGEAVGAAPTPLDVKIDGPNNPVKYLQTQPADAIRAAYTGHMAQLAAIREAMKAWAAVHGDQLSDRPYDIYTKGIEASFSTDGDFTLYWPLKAAGSK
jgi:hypothetical protein